MKTLFILCVLGLFYPLMNAQNRIVGRVTSADIQPLEGVSIAVIETNKLVLSDEKGAFTISNLPNGKTKIQFSLLGYENRMETYQLIGNQVDVKIALSPSIIGVEEVVVSGGYSSTQHQNAVKIEILKLNDEHLKTTPNFAESLTKVPGVDMISKGNGVSKPVIRGLSMNDILVLNNSVRFENYQYSSHHPLGIDEFGIENVEVIKGPASLLYGSDAIGGVINFIKEKPATTGSIVGDYNLQLFSNSLGVVNNLGVKGASNHVFGGLRIGQKSNADYLQGGGDYVPNSRFNEYSLKSNVGFVGNAGIFKLYYDHNQQNLGLVEEEAFDLIEKRGRKTEVFYQQLNTDMLSSQNKLNLGKMKLEVNGAYQNTALTHFAEADVYEIQMNLATLNYETKLFLPSDEYSEYIVGFQGMNQQNSNINDRETKLLPDATTNNYSAFVLLQRTFFEKMKLQTGIRFDGKTILSDAIGLPEDEDYRAALDKNYENWSGSLGATYSFSDALLFRINGAKAYRTPNLAELTSNGQHETRYEVGNENLVPENSFETDISMHWHKRNFSFDLAGFYNYIEDYIFIAPTGLNTASDIPIYQYKQSNSTLFGGEAGIHFHPEKFSWFHFESTYASVIGKQENGDYLPFVPANKLNFEVRGEKEKLAFVHNAFLSINSKTAFEQMNNAPDETTTDSYSLWDVAVGGKLKWGKQPILLRLSVNNLLDEQYIDHLSTLKEVNYFNPGRDFAFSMKIPFVIR